MTTTTKSSLSHIPAGVWVLGFVSLLMDVSSEMIHSLLPLFMVTVLGASALDGRADRRDGRIHGVDREGVLRRAERLSRQAQGAGACSAMRWVR